MKETKKIKSRTIISVVIIFLLLIPVLVAIIITSSQSDENKQVSSIEYSINDVIINNNYKITLDSVITDNHYGFINSNGEIETKNTENKFIIAALSIYNNSKAINVKLGNFKIKYLKNKNDPNLGINAEIEYDKIAILDISLNNITGISKLTIQPELIKTISVIFEVPNTGLKEDYLLSNNKLFANGSQNYVFKFQI